MLYEKMIRDCGIIVKVCEVSFKLSPSCTILGASLDGIVFSCYQTWCLEIKCPYSTFNSSLQEAIEDKKFFLVEGGHGIMLQWNHAYYYQLPDQIFCSNLKKLDFLVWFKDGEPLFKETIDYDEEFLLNYALPRLKYLYCSAVLPELFSKQIYLDLKLREMAIICPKIKTCMTLT